MENKTKWIIGIGSVVLIVGGTAVWYYGFHVPAKKKTQGGGNTGNTGDGGERVTGGGEGTIGSNEKLPSSGFPLAIGARGRKVLMLQQALKMGGQNNIAVDGRYGDETAKAQYAGCLSIGLMGGTPACKVDQGEFDALMQKAGGQTAVLNAIMNNSVTKAIYNQYL